MPTRLLNHVPVALTLLRAALGPVVLALAAYRPSPLVFACCLVIAFVSDIFDGVIARRLGVATEAVRRLDSVADSIFYVCAGISAYWLYPQAIRERLAPLCVLLALEVTRYVVDWAKFRRETSYHMWSSKLWGIFLFLGFFALLGFGQAGVLLTMAICVGILADAEGLLISLVLPVWRHDVPTVFHALGMRKALLAAP